ncbi:hypothetical protein A2Z22_05230 [Candidatus Woesebacteria bacterium RBG_16_34_12]|uniref:Right handed beta helix domain-containing protein n=1 Tax=Candidatus Woesebacteria bacterium RBG_16_34_12 TaxID=1802480 RepID=A0A1F7XB10_9BACT|nr:MAG: hypothetical protein A2Z22_05230 [Candidatus Woesebacteria bacterium RBG_16_34_12]
MGGQLIIEKSELSNNTGNLIYYGWAKLKIIGSTVVNNTNSSEFLNSVITNSSLDDGYYLGDITIANTIVWGNSDPSGIPPITLPGIHPYNNLPYTPIHIDYSLIQGGWPDTSSVGILDTDPLFVDFLNGDYHLTSSSPAIDSGDPNSPLDPDGSRADMGAYPFFHTLTPTETVNDLIDKVEIFNFQQGISSSLDAKLNAALNALDDLNENNDQAPQ